MILVALGGSYHLNGLEVVGLRGALDFKIVRCLIGDLFGALVLIPIGKGKEQICLCKA
jgi:hypothetical protein